jgi:hypothetical protein
MGPGQARQALFRRQRVSIPREGRRYIHGAMASPCLMDQTILDLAPADTKADCQHQFSVYSGRAIVWIMWIDEDLLGQN